MKGLFDLSCQIYMYRSFHIFLKIIYLFLAVHGLQCCLQAFSRCDEQELLFIVVRELLIVLVSLSRSLGSRCTGFSSCGTGAQ